MKVEKTKNSPVEERNYQVGEEDYLSHPAMMIPLVKGK